MLPAHRRRIARWVAAVAFLLVACGVIAHFSYLWRPKVPSRERAMREVAAPMLSDDLPLGDLASAIEQQVAHLSGRMGRMQFGPLAVSTTQYTEALGRLATHIRSANGVNEVLAYIRTNFSFFEVYGSPRWSEVFVTGYFEPVIRGAREASEQFSQPLYAQPSDLLTLDLSLFGEQFKDERHRRARVEGNRVVPYYTRAQIDSERALAGQGLEICWVDPVDAFFLQVQGSGVVQLEDGSEITVGFAEKNGQPYEAIGRFLKDAMAPMPPTYPNLVHYLQGLPRDKQQEVLNRNPSFVFFRKNLKNAVTALGVTATAGRTVATDHALFPPGALAFLAFQNTETGQRPAISSRFVLDQDVGGAIKGGGRVDLFFGRGQAAGAEAGVLQERARLFYLVPRGAVNLKGAE